MEDMVATVVAIKLHQVNRLMTRMIHTLNTAPNKTPTQDMTNNKPIISHQPVPHKGKELPLLLVLQL